MAFRLEPPKSNNILDIQQAWHRLRDRLNAEYIDTGWGNILFVDVVDGNDDTAKSGSITFAYATIQAALDAATDGDLVWVGPGEYTEDITWPETNNVTLQGVHSEAVAITNATAVETVTIAPTAAVDAFSIKNISLLNTDAEEVLLIDGSNYTSLGSQRAQIQNVSFDTDGLVALRASVVNNMELDYVQGQDDFYFSQIGNTTISNTTFDDLFVDNDPTGTEPSSGYGLLILDSVQCDNVSVDNIANVAFTDDTQINNLTLDVIDDDSGNWGSVNASGRILGDIDAQFTFDDTTANKTFCILDNAKISGVLLVRTTSTGDGGFCRALNAVFYDTSANSITADSEAIIDLRGSLFAQQSLRSQDNLTTTPGVIDRTWWVQEIASGNSGSAVNWGVPYATAPSTVGVESDTLAELPIAITAISTTQITCTKTADNEPHKVLAYLEYD